MSVYQVLADRLWDVLDPEGARALHDRLLQTGRPRALLLAALSGHPIVRADGALLAMCAEGMGPHAIPFGPAPHSLVELLEQLNEWEAERDAPVHLPDGTPVPWRELSTGETWYDCLRDLEVPIVGGDSDSTDTLVLLESGTYRLSSNSETSRWEGALADLDEIERYTRS